MYLPILYSYDGVIIKYNIMSYIYNARTVTVARNVLGSRHAFQNTVRPSVVMKFLLFFFISNLQLSLATEKYYQPDVFTITMQRRHCSKLQLLQSRWADYTARLPRFVRRSCVCANSVDDDIIIILLLLTSVLSRRMNIL